MYDDIIYISCLILCISSGKLFRSIKDDYQRKLYGTSLGVLITIIVSGIHVIHCFISFSICAIIIIYSHPRKCHLRSFIFMFGYLAFFRTTNYFGIPDPPGHTNMIQMILTLKMVGVALEVTNAYNKIKEKSKDTSSIESKSETPGKTDESEKNEITDYELELQNLSFIDMFHYAFSYIGVLVGPYYRYRTYRDYYKLPFRNYADCTAATTEKLKSVLLFISIYLCANYIWPLSYAMSDEFYQERSVIYRLYYGWPTFLIFRMRIYAGLVLGECVCTYAGFGAYPNAAEVKRGEGPTQQFLHMKSNPEKHEYNFETIKNLDAKGVETCVTFRESMKYWNVCVQYWLANNVYKRFPNKKYRILATLFVSSFWHGFYAGHYMCLMGAVFYVPVEDIYYKIYQKYFNTGLQSKIITGLFWLSRFESLAYLGIAFVLLRFEVIWYYYTSVYHFGYICYFVTLIIALILVKFERMKKKQGGGGGDS